MNVLAVVCARAGSSLEHKNLRRLPDGTRMIERAIDTAYASGAVTDVVVSTDYRPNVDFDNRGAFCVRRPERLAGPSVSKWPVYRHATEAWEAYTERTAAIVVDVDVSRPLVTPDTVTACVRATGDHEVVAAVAQSDKHPAFDIMRWSSHGLEAYDNTVHYTARQQLTPVWLHAGVYAMSRGALFGRATMFGGKVWGVEVPREQAMDVDDELDWRLAQYLDKYPPLGASRAA